MTENSFDHNFAASESTNTDALHVREQRSISELKIYADIKELFAGESLIERITEIREYIFRQYGDVMGHPTTQIRSRDVRAGAFAFVDHQKNAEVFFPALIKTIDFLYDYIVRSSGEISKPKNYERALRFSAVVYSLGITTHPYRDANGQTFRIAALSYLSELLDEGFSFPKYSKVRKSAPTSIVDFLDKSTPIGDATKQRIKNAAFNKLSDELQRVVSLRYKVPTEVDASSFGEELAVYSQAILSADRSDQDNMTRTEKELLDTYPQYADYTKFLFEVLREFPDEIFSSLEAIFNHPFDLNIPNYDDAASNVFTHSEQDQIKRLTEYLEAILLTPRGYGMLLSYIDTGKIVIEGESQVTEIADVLSKTLNGTTFQIYKLAKVDEKFCSIHIKIPAELLMKKYYGKSIGLHRLRYAVMNAFAALKKRS